MAYIDDLEAQGGLVAALMARLAHSKAVDETVSRIVSRRVVWLAGMGSSYAAALYGSYLLSGPDRWACALDAGEGLHYSLPSSFSHGTLIAISQSGASYETSRLAERLKGQTPIVALTNVPDSPLAATADLTLLLHVPPDEAISVKTYTATLTVLAVLATRSGGAPPLSPDQVCDAVTAVTVGGQQVAERLAPLLDAPALSVIGRGPSMASASFGALLLKEAAGRPAEALSGGQFRHGPMEMAGAGHGAVVLAPRGVTAGQQARLATDLASCGSSVVVIGAPELKADASRAQDRLAIWAIPQLPEPWAPLLEACALQWLAWACGVRAGRHVGHLDRTPRVVDHE